MATYKVIQDIEAEDKFLGPLTLKQFIFGATSALFIYLSVFAFTKNAAFLMVIFMPIALLGAFLAIPWSSDQPTEVWVLAKLRFKYLSKSRIWDQAGLEELVTITVPKKIEKVFTNGLDQTEVESRLKALADTIDTRGWAIKNATLNDAMVMPGVRASGERLINLESLPQAVPEANVAPYEDMMDEGNAVSENFEHMIQASSTLRKQNSLDKMERIRQGEPLSAIHTPEIHFTPPADAGSPVDEELLSRQLRNNKEAASLSSAHMQRMRLNRDGTKEYENTAPAADPSAQPQTSTADDDSAPVKDSPKPDLRKAQAKSTSTPDPAILDLAQRNDLNIDTVARMAKKNDLDDGEVVISLR